MSGAGYGYRWVVLAVTFLVNCIAIGFTWMCLTPLLSSIMRDFQLSGGSAGLLLSSYVMAIAIVVIPAGMFADRFGFKLGVSLGTVIIGVTGMLRGISSNFTQLFSLSLLTGVGMALIMPNLPKMVGEWFEREDFGLANGIVMAGMGVGNGLILMLVGTWFLPSFGWQTTFVIIGGLSLFTALLWVILAKERVGVKEAPHSHQTSSIPFREGFLRIIRVRDLWLLIGIQFCILGTFVGFLGFLHRMLEETKGMSGADASLAVSSIMLAAIVANIVIPRLSDKVHRRKPFIIIFGISTACSIYLIGILDGTILWFLLSMLGFSLGAYTPLIFVIPLEMEGIGSELVGTASGLIFCIGNVGGAVVAPIAGTLIEASGSYGPSTAMFVILALFIAIFNIPMRETGGNTEPS
ncbi:MAG: MFS transporter [Halobacteriota archaeon]|nr:MFS transporter [Halobacteriota archaeon]